jgi:hypothetical protein
MVLLADGDGNVETAGLAGIAPPLATFVLAAVVASALPGCCTADFGRFLFERALI